MRWSRISLWTQSLLYMAAGVNHFLSTRFYVAIMPDHYRDPRAWVLGTGVAEVVGGVGLLIPRTRGAAAIGIAAMLVGYLEVHVWMLRHPERFPGIPGWTLWARLSLQVLLIGWALWYVRRRDDAR